MHKHGCGDTCTCPEPHHYLCMAERYAAEWWRVVNGGGTSKEIHANWKLAHIKYFWDVMKGCRVG